MGKGTVGLGNRNLNLPGRRGFCGFPAPADFCLPLAMALNPQRARPGRRHPEKPAGRLVSGGPDANYKYRGHH